MEGCWVNGNNLGENYPYLPHFVLLMKMSVIMFSISAPLPPKATVETHQKPLIPRIKSKTLDYCIVRCAARLPVSVLGGAVPLSARDTPWSTNVAWCRREDDDDVCLPYLPEPTIPQQSTFQRRCNVVVEILGVR